MVNAYAAMNRAFRVATDYDALFNSTRVFNSSVNTRNQ